MIWTITAKLDNGSTIVGSYSDDSAFSCTDNEVAKEISNKEIMREKVPPLGILPFMETLKVSYYNPASIAAAFCEVVAEKYRNVLQEFTFEGEDYLLPDIEDDIDGGFALDSYSDADEPVEKLWRPAKKLSK